MTERNQIPGLLDLLQNSSFGGALNKSPFAKRSQRRYDINEIMNQQKGILTSPGKGRLDADSLQ